MTPEELTPGIYATSCNVPAPRPDKRVKYDWRAAPIAAGAKFRVTDAFWIRHGLLSIASLYGYSTNSILAHDEDARALLASFIRVENLTASEMLALDHNEALASPLLDILVASGRLTLAEVSALAKQYYDSLED